MALLLHRLIIGRITFVQTSQADGNPKENTLKWKYLFDRLQKSVQIRETCDTATA